MKTGVPPTPPVSITQKPVQNAPPPKQLPPPATKPETNEIATQGRRITHEEVAAARKYFEERLAECTAAIEHQLPPIDCDFNDLMQRMVASGCASDAQVRLIDLLKAGDVAGAKELWIVIMPGEPCPLPRRGCGSSSGHSAGRCAPAAAPTATT
jgi:hypothetical protein